MNTKKFGPKTITPDLKLQYIILVSWSLELKTSERIKETNPNMVLALSFLFVRYDRLRIVAGKIQSVVGDIAAQGERLQALLSWRDPRATAIFVTFCLIIAMVLYITPFKLFALLSGYYFMRHPRLRHRIPSAPLNFFRRLPAMTDSML